MKYTTESYFCLFIDGGGYGDDGGYDDDDDDGLVEASKRIVCWFVNHFWKF